MKQNDIRRISDDIADIKDLLHSYTPIKSLR